MGTMLIGFVSRVSFGHSGRPLQAPDWLWLVYWSAHFAAALRVLASLLQLTALMQVSLTIWIIAILVWGAKLLPAYLQPRADGSRLTIWSQKAEQIVKYTDAGRVIALICFLIYTIWIHGACMVSFCILWKGEDDAAFHAARGNRNFSVFAFILRNYRGRHW
jgi:hypothetical protein